MYKHTLFIIWRTSLVEIFTRDILALYFLEHTVQSTMQSYKLLSRSSLQIHPTISFFVSVESMLHCHGNLRYIGLEGIYRHTIIHSLSLLYIKQPWHISLALKNLQWKRFCNLPQWTVSTLNSSSNWKPCNLNLLCFKLFDFLLLQIPLRP